MNVNNSSLMQLYANASYASQIRENNSTNQYIMLPENVSVVYELGYFVNSTLSIPQNSDKILPEYLILDLFNSNTSLDDIYNYGRNISLVFNIGVQIIELPLSLLWNLNTPEIIDNKLYLHIPFETFFGKIKLFRLNNNTVTFHIKNMFHLANYGVNIGLLYKSYMYGNRDSLFDISYNIIQQISSIELNVSLNELNNESREFVLNTEQFEGFIKGFFIESRNIDELQELQFFINGYVKTNYDRFLIRNKCIKISENMLYYPFNSDISYQERIYNSFDGSISLDQITQSKLRLKFTNPRNKVKIYGLNMNDFRQQHGQTRLTYNINNFHIVNDFNSHPLLSFNELISSPLPLPSPMSMLGINSTNNTLVPDDIYINSNNYINQQINYTFDYTGYRSSTGATGATGATGPAANSYYVNDISGNYVNNNLNNRLNNNSNNRVNNNSNNSNNYLSVLPVGDTIHRQINEDKRICGISWDEILTHDIYMSCSHCNNNFKEADIKQWLQQRITCPTCRGVWNNFNLYINN